MLLTPATVQSLRDGARDAVALGWLGRVSSAAFLPLTHPTPWAAQRDGVARSGGLVENAELRGVGFGHVGLAGVLVLGPRIFASGLFKLSSRWRTFEFRDRPL
jgi:hypothetical protein